MVKTYQNLELLAQDPALELSILESRKTNQANLCLAEDYNLRSTPKRMASAAKLVQYQRGLRKSSSLTNGMSPGRNKTALREYGTEARGLILSCDNVNAPILGNSGEQLTIAERRRH
jgi:hypothetical protein